MPKRAGFTYGALIFLLAVCGLCLLIIFSPPFAVSRAILDRLAKDGNLEMFSNSVYQLLRIPALLLGGGMIGLLVTGFIKRRYVLAKIDQALYLPGKIFHRLVQEGNKLNREICSIQMKRTETLLFVCLVLFAIVFRAAFIMRPMDHDEAYTVVVFASAPLKEALADYHHPNNHLFHTILVHFAIKLLGSSSSMIASPWVVRLPAFLMGVLLVPAVYFFTRMLYGRLAAFLAGSLTACLPALIFYSVNARGYTIIMLFTLLIFMLAGYVRKHKSLLGWGLLVLFSTLGFYTIPIFLYSYAVMLVWFFLTVWIRQEGEEYSSTAQILKWLIISGVATLIFTFLLYVPVFLRYHGVGILFQAVSTPPSWGEFTEILAARYKDNLEQWLVDLPSMIGYLVGVGLMLSIILPPENWPLIKRVENGKTSTFSPLLLLLATAGTMVALTLGLRPNLYSRFLSFLIPLLIIWISGGWSALLKRIERWLCMPAAFPWGVAMLLFGAMIVGSGIRIFNYAEKGYFQPGNIERTSLFLKDNLQETDLVVVSPPYDAALWYYSRLYGINMRHYKRELPFFRAYVVVDPTQNQTLESVLVDRGPELFFFDLDQAQIAFQFGSVSLFECIPYADLIRSEYHVK